MPKLIKDRITILDGRISFDFKLREPITLVQGDSATGKTWFYNLYQKCAFDDNTVLFINWKDKNTVETLLKNAKDKLIVIDNADIVLPDSLALSFRKNKYNQYILFGMDTEKYGLGNRNIASLYEVSPGKIELEYMWGV